MYPNQFVYVWFSRQRICLEAKHPKRIKSKLWWPNQPKHTIPQSIDNYYPSFFWERSRFTVDFFVRYQKIRGQGQVGPVPGNYCCFKCGMPGHWIKQCPLNMVRSLISCFIFILNIPIRIFFRILYNTWLYFRLWTLKRVQESRAVSWYLWLARKFPGPWWHLLVILLFLLLTSMLK